jgi:hypothetical protein
LLILVYKNAGSDHRIVSHGTTDSVSEQGCH